MALLVVVGKVLSAGVVSCIRVLACITWSGSLGAGEEGKVRERQAVVRGYRPGVLSYILLCPVECESLGM